MKIKETVSPVPSQVDIKMKIKGTVSPVPYSQVDIKMKIKGTVSPVPSQVDKKMKIKETVYPVPSYVDIKMKIKGTVSDFCELFNMRLPEFLGSTATHLKILSNIGYLITGLPTKDRTLKDDCKKPSSSLRILIIYI